MSELNQAEKLIKQIYDSWDVIYEDEDGKHKLPTNRKVIDSSTEYLSKLEKIATENNEYKQEYQKIRKVLDHAVKRKFNFSIKIFIAMVLWMGFIIIMTNVHKKPGWFYEGMTESRILLDKKQNLQKAENRIASNETLLEAGYENYYKEWSWKEKEKKESWKRLKKDLKADKKYIKHVTPLDAEKYKKYNIKYYGGMRTKGIVMLFIYGLSYILYLYASMRPNYLYWKTGKGSFGKLENAVGLGIASTAFTALYTVPYATVKKVRWSNGVITKATTSFGANIFVSGFILLFLFFYYIIIAMTVPFRAIINYIRNYVLYI